jgi:hypothetical protein
MRTVYTSLVLSIVSLAAAPQFSGQTKTPKLPFTLTISVNPAELSGDDTSDKVVRVKEEGVTVRIRKTNTTNHEIPKQGVENGAYGCAFDVRDSKGNQAPPAPHGDDPVIGGGIAWIVGTKEAVLQPNESNVDSAPLSEWYDLTKPGTYTIQVSQHVSSDPASPVVKSNKITITVTQ